MTYQKQTWNNYNDSLSIEQNKANNAFATPEGLNHLEDGVKKVDEEVESARGTHLNLSKRLTSTDRQLIEITKNKPATFSREEKKPMVTFLDDDGKTEVYTRLRPIFKSKGVPLSACLITSYLDETGYITKEQAKEMIADGFEMLGHTHDAHKPNMPSETIEHIEKDVAECRRQLGLLGSTSRGFVYPQGQSNLTIRKHVQGHFDFAFSETGINQDDNINPMQIKRVGFGNWGAGADLEKYKRDVDDALAKNAWLVFMVHVGTGTTPEEELAILPNLIDYIKSKGISIVNATEGYNYYGSKIFIGDRKSKYLNITNNAMYTNIPIESEKNVTQHLLKNNSMSSAKTILYYEIGISRMLSSYNHSNADGGFPSLHAGIVETHVYSHQKDEAVYNFQTFKAIHDPAIYTRNALTLDTWGEWEQLLKKGDSIIEVESNSIRTNADKPNSYKIGKITYSKMSSAHMATAGFPITNPALLKTDNMTGDYYLMRQTLERGATNDVYTRVSTSGSSWSAWAKINTTVV